MAETFYSVLGVDADADIERIQTAYRELVKTHHPDVSDDDDAVEQFKRITKARDVLTDESSRKRYDRVGHNTYVRRYMDGDAWTVDHNTGRSTGSTTTSSTSTDTDRTSARSRSTSSSSGPRDYTPGDSGDENRGWSRTGNRSRTRNRDRSGSSSAGSRSDTSSSGETSASESAESGAGESRSYERYRSQYTGEETMGGESTENGRAWTEDVGADDFTDSQNGFGGSEFTWEKENPSTEGNETSGRARADGWRAQAASSAGYRPTGNDPATSSTPTSSVVGIRTALRQIGPWLAFHFVFLVSAFVTILLLISWTASVATVLLSLVLLGGAVFFSVLHMISRIYS